MCASYMFRETVRVKENGLCDSVEKKRVDSAKRCCNILLCVRRLAQDVKKTTRKDSIIVAAVQKF